MINRTAVICHGPSLWSSVRGDLIDSHRFVIRFPYINDWQLQVNYGKKTSYFCATVGRIKKRLNKQIPEFGYFLFSKEAKNKIDNFCKNLIKKHGGADITDLVESWRCKLTRCHHPYFSHGTVGILAALHYTKLPVTVFGADLLKYGVTDTPYIGSWFYENRRPHKMGHPLDQERRLIDEMSASYNLEVLFI